MAEDFKRPGSPEFLPPKQEEVRTDFQPVQPDLSTDTPTTGNSRAKILVDSYEKTITFAKWLEGILDEDLKDVVVEIDPAEQPEVWMAMQRIFANPNPKISYKSFTQVLAALEEIDKVEATIDNPFDEEDQFIKSLEDQPVGEIETPTPEMSIDTEDEAALNEATKIRTFNSLES